MKKTILASLFLLLKAFQASAQNNPSSIEWDFSSPSTYPAFVMDDNWIHTIIQASDGNFIGVGFSDEVPTGERHPAILKYNPGRYIVWEKITTYDQGIQLQGGVGGYTDVIEVTEGG
jgi:hypothetical protein